MVATPIGNLDDITSRAIQALQSADLVTAEDTRRTKKLLSHLGLSKPVESFHGDSSAAKRDRLIRKMQAGQTIAFVSDAGTPTISDPGAELVEAALQAAIPVCPIPGPSAITTALSASGLNADRFIFLGYPPRKQLQLREFCQVALSQPWTTVLYESPHRIATTLRELGEIAPDRYTVIGRELTKKFEEFLRGPLRQLAAHFAEHEPRGEFVLMLECAQHIAPQQQPDLPAVRNSVQEMLQAGVSVKIAAGIIQRLTSMSRNDAYQLALKESKRTPEA